MQVLVSSPKRLALVDLETGNISVVEDHRPQYFGITWTFDGRLSLTHSGVPYDDVESLDDYLNSEVGRQSIGPLTTDPIILAPHQTLCIDDIILTTNTGRNGLLMFRTQDGWYRHLWLNQQHWNRDSKSATAGNLLNALFYQPGKLFALAHNFGRGSCVAEWSWERSESGQVILPDEPVLHQLAVNDANNFWITPENEWIVTNTRHFCLADAQSGQAVWQTPNQSYFPLGLASDGEHVIVGGSALGSRSDRLQADSFLWVIERRTWRTVRTIALPWFGSIFDIRLIDRPDLCHHQHVLSSAPAIDPEATDRYHRMTQRSRWQSNPRPAPLVGDVLPSMVAGKPAQPTHPQDAQRFERLSGTWYRDEDWFHVDQEGALAVIIDHQPAPPKKAGKGEVVPQYEARIELPTLKDPSLSGLITHYTGPSDANMYACLILTHLGFNQLELWRNQNGTWTKLLHTPIATTIGRVGMSLEGNRVIGFWNGKPVAEWNDPAPLPVGKIGIRANAGRAKFI